MSRYHPLDADKQRVEDALARLFAEQAGAEVVTVPHIYHVAKDDDLWGELKHLSPPLVVFSWLHPRAAEWVLRSHGVGDDDLRTFDMGAFDGPEACFEAAAAYAGATTGTGGVRELTADVTERWYPVIDYSRCINCQQCLQFCLFGVYELDASGRVAAVQPDHCKPGCPACARICPRGAIVFPLYTKDDAIAGAPGKFVRPNEAARRMFETRTRRPHQPEPEEDSDLDDLIDDLERLTRGSQ